MSTDQSDHTDEESAPNFFNLKKCLSTECTKFLRKLLSSIFPNFASVKNSIPLHAFETKDKNGFINQKNENLILKSKNLRKFKFELLCNIFKSGACDEFLDPPAVGWLSKEYPEPEHLGTSDDIKRLWTIWDEDITGNEDEELSDNDSNSAWYVLQQIACRMAQSYPGFGTEFKHDIQTEREKMRPNGTSTSDNFIQSGNRNEMRINVYPGAQSTINCNAVGHHNKICVVVQNQLMEHDIPEDKRIRLTIHCDNKDKEQWMMIKGSVAEKSPQEFNESPHLQEHKIQIKEIQNGCLIVDFTVGGMNDIEPKLHALLSCIFQRSNAFDILANHGTPHLNLHGYVYDPQSYIIGAGTQEDFNIYDHVTMFLREGFTICDVDLFVSNLLGKLIESEFSSQVEESICIQIKGNILEPHYLMFSSLQRAFIRDVDKQIAVLNRCLDKISDVKIASIVNIRKTTHVVLKTEKCLNYQSLVSREGPLLAILGYILESDALLEQMSDVKLLKLGMLVDTLNNGFDEKGQDLVFYLSSDSKIKEAIENGSFPKILTTLLGGDDNLKNVNQLKLRAVVDHVQDHGGDDQNNYTELSVEVPAFQILDRFQRITKELEVGNIREAKSIAHLIYQSLESDDVAMFRLLLEIYDDCADNFYSLKCFCKVRLLQGDTMQLPEMLIEAMIYWMKVLEGPYDVEEILKIIAEIECMAFEALAVEEKKSVALVMCREIILSYNHLMAKFRYFKDKIERKLLNVQLEVFKMFLKDGQYDFVCSLCKMERRNSMNGELLYVWALALKGLQKYDVAMKKVEEAIQYSENMKDTTLIKLKELRKEFQIQLDKGFASGSDINTEWLEGTNINSPQQMKVHALLVKSKHTKKPVKHRPKKQHEKRNDLPQTETPAEQNLHRIYTESTSFSSWKDVPPYVPEAAEKRKIRRKSKKTSESNEEQGVEELDRAELSETDTDHDSDNENVEKKNRPFYYQDPEYEFTESDCFTDSGLGTCDEVSAFDQMSMFSNSVSKESLLNNTDLVVNGIDLTDRCETGFSSKNKNSFNYLQEKSQEELMNLFKQNPSKYKKCTIEIESAHKAVCTNLNFADEMKEIHISGRSKCGRSFTDDEVVVEILGESKVRSNIIPRLKIDIDKQQTRDTNTYGQVLGTVKRHRYRNLAHPVLVCSKDEFAIHMMKPLCKTVPKIQVSHEFCENNYQVDLFSYDKDKKIADYRETLDINQAHKTAYCFLVAIINWDAMYPFGITLKVINTKGDIMSGIDILRLQYRVPASFETETIEAADNLLKMKAIQRKGKVLSVFTMSVDGTELLDSAYSVDKLDVKLFRVGVHICDPTSIIQKGSAVDVEARRRGAIFDIGKGYLPIQMLPKELVLNKIAFCSGEERNALTLFFTISVDTGEHFISDVSVRKTTVKSVQNLNASNVQRVLESKKANNLIEEQIKILQEIALKLRKYRLGHGAYFTELESSLQHDTDFMKYNDSISMVKELHVFTNNEIAKLLTDWFPESTPSRCHARPSDDVIIKWMNDHMEVRYVLMYLQENQLLPRYVYSLLDPETEKIRYRHVLPIQKCVWERLLDCIKSKRFDCVNRLLGTDEIYPWQALALEEWYNIQVLAEYKCSSKYENLSHYELRFPAYTAFTAPLRRYIDLVVHRLVHAYIEKQQNCPYQKSEIEDICNEMNEVRRHRKLFFRSCQVLLCGHELHELPQIYNGFVQNVTNINIELCFPSLRKLPRLSKLIPLNLLQTRQRPTFEKERDYNRNIMTLKWQNRIYAFKRKTVFSPKESECLRLNPHPQVEYQKLSEWINILKALVRNREKDYKSLFYNTEHKGMVQTRPECWNTVNDVSSEVRDGNFSKQTCSYSLSFNYGQIIVVQMSADAKCGLLQPIPQLLDITNNVKLCLQHVRDPVGVLSQLSVSKTKDKYNSCKEYISLWMPVYSMEVATETIEDDTITINDLPITFHSRGGSFTLRYSYLEKRDIEFTSHSIDLLGDASDRSLEDDIEKFYLSGSDFLCIRCELHTNITPKANFGEGVISPNRRFWIGHAKIDDVKFKTKKNKERIVKIHFVCHNRCPAIPPEMKNQKQNCSVEILPKSGVHRRTELYVKWLESASDLAKAIAQRRKIPDLEKSHYECGSRIQDTSIKELGIKHNKDQNQAIKKALTSSFSLIQGPPGTGKTFTGVALIKLFCFINHQLREQNQSHKYVVFCGPSNKSVDLVTGYLMEKFGTDLKMLRMYGEALECAEFPIPGKVFSKRRSNVEHTPDVNLRDVSLHHLIRKPGRTYAEKITDFDRKFRNAKVIDYKEIKEYKNCIGSAIREEIPRYDVILCTTSVATSSRLLSATKKSIFQLLIDEAGMCTEPECLAAIVATQAKQVILIGDHKQLRPVVLCEDAAELGLQKSMFERYAETNTSILTFMRNQYRMNPGLCRFPSRMFYENKLATQDSLKWRVNKPLRLWRDPKNPFVFCHVKGEEEYLSYATEEGNEMSRYNMAEVDQVVKVYSHLLKKEGVDHDDINVMSQYNAQCTKIRLGLKRQKFSVVNVNTVVASQGGEWDYVIFSLVRSLPEYRIEPKPTLGWCKENLGFITDDHQVNVALTRARKGLIIIGNKKLMECDEFVFKPLLEEYGRHGCIEDAEDFPSNATMKMTSKSQIF